MSFANLVIQACNVQATVDVRNNIEEANRIERQKLEAYERCFLVFDQVSNGVTDIVSLVYFLQMVNLGIWKESWFSKDLQTHNAYKYIKNEASRILEEYKAVHGEDGVISVYIAMSAYMFNVTNEFAKGVYSGYCSEAYQMERHIIKMSPKDVQKWDGVKGWAAMLFVAVFLSCFAIWYYMSFGFALAVLVVAFVVYGQIDRKANKEIEAHIYRPVGYDSDLLTKFKEQCEQAKKGIETGTESYKRTEKYLEYVKGKFGLDLSLEGVAVRCDMAFRKMGLEDWNLGIDNSKLDSGLLGGIIRIANLIGYPFVGVKKESDVIALR